MKWKNKFLILLEMIFGACLPADVVAQPLALNAAENPVVFNDQQLSSPIWLTPIGSIWTEMPSGPRWEPALPYTFYPVREEKSRSGRKKLVAILPSQDKKKRKFLMPEFLNKIQKKNKP